MSPATRDIRKSCKDDIMVEEKRDRTQPAFGVATLPAGRQAGRQTYIGQGFQYLLNFLVGQQLF